MRFILPAVVLVCGLAVAYALLVGKPKPEPNAPVPERAPIVQVVLAEPREVTLSVRSQGTVQPRREINIVSQVAGRVQHVAEHFADGGFFEANTELVKVEDFDYQFDLIRAQARVADAQQLVAIEKGRVRQAAREWRDLGNEEANQLFLREPQLASAEAALRAAEADLGEARLNLERTSLKVPFNGRVREKHVDSGQYISLGTPVARVYATDVVEIRLPLTDRQVGLLDLPLSFEDGSVLRESGAAVTLSARFADREWQWQGQVVRTDASIDVDSRVVYVVVEVERPFAREAGSDRPPLSIGLFVDAEISGRSLPQVSLLPRDALRNDGSVLVVDESDHLQVRSVRVLKSNLRQLWVQGLVHQERVVVSQLPIAIAGMRVTVQHLERVAVGGIQ
ncbi:MAG: efflux RND transporter periplasmic adaptor subunit [Gammaproteobacteria bacterium]|nr:efflux RND transporter periplasmic adaptor subunit [Gammaproteobacteria bacterium]